MTFLPDATDFTDLPVLPMPSERFASFSNKTRLDYATLIQ